LRAVDRFLRGGRSVLAWRSFMREKEHQKDAKETTTTVEPEPFLEYAAQS
jgi:hypothetical protein